MPLYNLNNQRPFFVHCLPDRTFTALPHPPASTRRHLHTHGGVTKAVVTHGSPPEALVSYNMSPVTSYK